MSMSINQGRKDLAALFGGIGVEVGTEQGEYAEVIATFADVLYCVDAWKAHKGYRDHTRQSKLDRFYAITQERLGSFLNVWLVRLFSMDAVKTFADNSLDFVYIDANHDYEHVTEDITEWAKKVKPGGIVSGHDYTKRKGQDKYYDVVRAVDDYVAAHGKELTIWRGDSPASWSFIS